MKLEISSKAVCSVFVTKSSEDKRRSPRTKKRVRVASMPSLSRIVMNPMTHLSWLMKRDTHSWLEIMSLTLASSLIWSSSTCWDIVTNLRITRTRRIIKTRSCLSHCNWAPRQRIDSLSSIWMRPWSPLSSKDTSPMDLNLLSSSPSKARRSRLDCAHTSKMFWKSWFNGMKS